MSKPKRRKKSDMALMPIADQQELQQRLSNRRDVEEAVKHLVATLTTVLNGDVATLKAFVANFYATGHWGQYHETPTATTHRRTVIAQVKKHLRETPLNWMGAIELSYNLQRINLMDDALSQLIGIDSTLKDILDLYRGVGDDIRQKVYAEMGHWPEEFPVPRDRITGDESDDLFKLVDYQPPLF